MQVIWDWHVHMIFKMDHQKGLTVQSNILKWAKFIHRLFGQAQMKTASKYVKRYWNWVIGNRNKHKNELTVYTHQLGKN